MRTVLRTSSLRTNFFSINKNSTLHVHLSVHLLFVHHSNLKKHIVPLEPAWEPEEVRSKKYDFRANLAAHQELCKPIK